MSLDQAISQLRSIEDSHGHTGPLPVPLTGLEAILAGAIRALPEGSWWVPGLRERLGATLLGVPDDRLNSAFAGAAPYRVAPTSPSPANRALHAVGLAHGSGRHALVHLGVGSTADGAFAEALNLAALVGAKVLFVVAEYPLDDQAPVARQSAAGATALAQAYGLDVFPANGNHADSVLRAVQTAAALNGPAVIVATLAPEQPITSGESA